MGSGFRQEKAMRQQNDGARRASPRSRAVRQGARGMSDRGRFILTGVAALFVIGGTVAWGGHGLSLLWDEERAGPHHQGESIALEDFDGIRLQSPDNLVVTHGDGFAVRLEGDAVATRHVSLAVRGGVLHIARRRVDGGHWSGDDEVTVHVTMPALTRIWMLGSGNVQVEKVQGKAFAAELEGSGDMHVDALDTGSVALTLRGSGDLVASGRTRDLRAAVQGSGDMSLEALTAQTASISVLGSGHVSAHAQKNATLAVTGSGEAHIAGTTACQISKMGSGEAKCES
jgi:hypothetical protein